LICSQTSWNIPSAGGGTFILLMIGGNEEIIQDLALACARAGRCGCGQLLCGLGIQAFVP